MRSEEVRKRAGSYLACLKKSLGYHLDKLQNLLVPFDLSLSLLSSSNAQQNRRTMWTVGINRACIIAPKPPINQLESHDHVATRSVVV